MFLRSVASSIKRKHNAMRAKKYCKGCVVKIKQVDKKSTPTTHIFKYSGEKGIFIIYNLENY